MKKSGKTNIIIILVILAAIVGAFFFFKNTGTLSIYDLSYSGSCTNAIDMYTEGANEGECFIYTLNNQKTVLFVESVVEKITSGGTISCKVHTTQDPESVSTCDTAKEDGVNSEVCITSSDCTLGNCVNHVCKSTSQPCITGETQCINSGSYKKCLSSTWSGILSCSSGTVCYEGSCVSSICTVGKTKCVGDNLYTCQDKFTWVNNGISDSCKDTNGNGGDNNSTMWIIIGAICGLLLIILLSKKK